LSLIRVPVGEPVLQFDVPELVNGASLAENPSLVSILEEAHE
jgi:hypothetical protein